MPQSERREQDAPRCNATLDVQYTGIIQEESMIQYISKYIYSPLYWIGWVSLSWCEQSQRRGNVQAPLSNNAISCLWFAATMPKNAAEWDKVVSS